MKVRRPIECFEARVDIGERFKQRLDVGHQRINHRGMQMTTGKLQAVQSIQQGRQQAGRGAKHRI